MLKNTQQPLLCIEQRPPLSQLKLPFVAPIILRVTLLRCSSDELHAYLKRCRPDLCIIDGEEEGEADYDEEGFVLIEGREEDEEQEEEAMLQRRCSSADDWEVSGFPTGGSSSRSQVTGGVSLRPNTLVDETCFCFYRWC